jgi:hypothetical protein
MTAKLFILFISLMIGSCGFGNQTKTVETKRGRLKYVQTMEYRTGGIHGSKDWYGTGRHFVFNDRKWTPDEDFDGCEASPNEAVEAFNCFKFKNLTETALVLRVKDDKPFVEKIFEGDSRESGGNNLGEWVNAEGKWLIFKDFFDNVETSERKEIKGLPDYPSKYYRAASPDLETVIYQGACFYGFPEASDEIKRNREKVCNNSPKYDQKNLEILWLIDAQTGETKFIELSRDKYDWLTWNPEKFAARRDWLNAFQSRIVWKKDKNDKYQLAEPK